MTINVLWVILAFAIGPGTGRLIEGSASTADASHLGPPVTHCYINGQWYNPCPADPEPEPTPPIDPLIQQ